MKSITNVVERRKSSLGKDNCMIPIYHKLNLTIEETAIYSNIGENTLRKIISENPTLDFISYVGKKVLIKRAEFEKWNSKQYIIK